MPLIFKLSDNWPLKTHGYGDFFNFDLYNTTYKDFIFVSDFFSEVDAVLLKKP